MLWEREAKDMTLGEFFALIFWVTVGELDWREKKRENRAREGAASWVTLGKSLHLYSLQFYRHKMTEWD